MILGKQSLKTLIGIHPDLVKVMQTAIIDTPVDFTITDGVRTVAMQKALYAQGRTKPGGIVTKADGIIHKSNHQVKADGYGHAVDLYPYVNGAIDFNGIKLPEIATHIKQVAASLGVSITWGGDWTMAKDGIVDRPHFELR
jgi:peptidoglycan L-alanyl-D-glutamate endopeptidase CwlK